MLEGGNILKKKIKDSCFRMCHQSVKLMWKVEALHVLIDYNAQTKTQVSH